MNVFSVCKCMEPVSSSEAARSLLSLSWLYFHSGILHCIMNVFPGRFHPYSHAHEGADAAASDSPTFTFSSGLLSGGEAGGASNAQQSAL